MKNKFLANLLLIFIFCNHLYSAEKVVIGVLSVAIGDVFNQDGQKLKTGDKIYFGDSIKVDVKSNSQILLLDQTVLNVGANSEVLLDEFVYDPKTNNGKIISEIKKGSLKVITGAISEKNPANLEVKVPAGSIGTRGTEFQATVNENNQEAKILLIGPGPQNTLGLRPGAVEVGNNSGSVLLDKPYSFTRMTPTTAPITPIPVPQNELNEFNRSLEAKLTSPTENNQTTQPGEEQSIAKIEEEKQVVEQTLYNDKKKEEIIGSLLVDKNILLALVKSNLSSTILTNAQGIATAQPVINELSKMASTGEITDQQFFLLVGKDEKGNEIINTTTSNSTTTDSNMFKIDAVKAVSTSAATSSGSYKYNSGTISMAARDGTTSLGTNASYSSTSIVDFTNKTISSSYDGTFKIGSNTYTFSSSSGSTLYTSTPTQQYNFTTSDIGGDYTSSYQLKNTITSLDKDGSLNGTSADFSTTVADTTPLEAFNKNDLIYVAGFGTFSTTGTAATGSSSLTLERSSADKSSDLATFQGSLETLTGSNNSITPTKE
jgi:hypothetical protein